MLKKKRIKQKKLSDRVLNYCDSQKAELKEKDGIVIAVIKEDKK